MRRIISPWKPPKPDVIEPAVVGRFRPNPLHNCYDPSEGANFVFGDRIKLAYIQGCQPQLVYPIKNGIVADIEVV